MVRSYTFIEIFSLLSSLHVFFSCFRCRLMTFFKIIIFRVSNRLVPDQDRHSVGPDLVQTVCKGYQQTTKVASSNGKS